MVDNALKMPLISLVLQVYLGYDNRLPSGGPYTLLLLIVLVPINK